VDLDKLSSLAERILFVVAFLLLGVAVVARAAIWQPMGYTPWHLLELAVVALIFVVALLLRQIRQELRKPKQP
jgi:hypothetical protein